MGEEQTIVMHSGRRVRLDEFFSKGGQGLTYRATDLRNGMPCIIKQFHNKYCKPATKERTRFLVQKKLHKLCRELKGPTDYYATNGVIGHLTPFVKGLTLESALKQPRFTFIQGIGIALSVAQLVKKLHNHGIVYGDIQLNNFIIRKTKGVFRVSAIDFDNFSVNGLPPAEMYGHVMHIAPEIRSCQRQRKHAFQSKESDLYSLSVVLHQILLLKHPAIGHDHSEDDLAKAMAGEWQLDPARHTNGNHSINGYPVDVLNNELCSSFRLGLSRDPAVRPSAGEWVQVLSQVINRVFICPICNFPTIIDSSKTVCSSGRHTYPLTRLIIKATGKQLVVNKGTMVIGRKDLGGSISTSKRHAILHRYGPETWLTSIGRNGSYRWSNSGWISLKHREPVLLAAGDRLRLAEIEVTVDSIANGNQN